jgi:hypothetical protein
MFGTRRLISRSGLVRMLCALSLLLVAFAHKPLVSSAAASAYVGVDVADFILPDGTLPDLCLGGEEEGHHSAFNHCEACRIDVPSAVDVFVVNPLSPAAHLTARLDDRVVRSFLRPGASPRGPPSRNA